MTRLLKIFVFALSFLAASLLIPTQSWASYLDLQGQNPAEVFKQALESDNMNYSQFSLSSMDQMIMGLSKKLSGYPQLEGETTNTSLLNSTTNAIAYLYSNQPSFVHYLAYESQRLNLAKPAYAANGQGWDFLGDTTLYIWTKSRNIAYLFFVVIFVAIGFMIMFRSKLNPQTVINIQLALPKIVISLIMVTFSYALSGLMVDVVYFGHNLIRGIITNQSGNCYDGSAMHKIFGNPESSNPNPTAVIPWEQDCLNPDVLKSGSGVVVRSTPSVWPFDVLGQYAGGNVKTFLSNMFTLLFQTISGSLSGDFGPLFQLIISFSVVSAVFKIFFSLLTKYVMIVILVITMPFSFLGSALSFQSSPIKPLKALLANTISFPATSLLLALAYYFGSSSVKSTGDLPPFYMSGFTTAIDPTTSAITSTLIAIGILMAIPTILATIDKVFEAQPISQAAAEQIAGGFRKIPIIGGMMG